MMTYWSGYDFKMFSDNFKEDLGGYSLNGFDVIQLFSERDPLSPSPV